MAHSGKRIAFFDIDNTLIRGSTIFFLGRGMYQRGFFSKKDIAAFVLANLRYRMTGNEKPEEIKRFQDAATNFIGGHDVKEIEIIGGEIYDEYVSPALWQGTINIARTHLEKGEEVWLVTAAPDDMAELISKRLGFSGALGTKAEIKDGKYTGALAGILLHGDEKARAIKKLAEERGLDLSQCFAYSDSYHDLPLLRAVGHPRAINPDAKLRIIAFKLGWPVHDFRRMRGINRVIGPMVSRIAGLAAYLSPRRK